MQNHSNSLITFDAQLKTALARQDIKELDIEVFLDRQSTHGIAVGTTTIHSQILSPNIHTIHNNYNPGIIIHTSHAERLAVIPKLLQITGNNILRQRSPELVVIVLARKLPNISMRGLTLKFFSFQTE